MGRRGAGKQEPLGPCLCSSVILRGPSKLRAIHGRLERERREESYARLQEHYGLKIWAIEKTVGPVQGKRREAGEEVRCGGKTFPKGKVVVGRRGLCFLALFFFFFGHCAHSIANQKTNYKCPDDPGRI